MFRMQIKQPGIEMDIIYIYILLKEMLISKKCQKVKSGEEVIRRKSATNGWLEEIINRQFITV